MQMAKTIRTGLSLIVAIGLLGVSDSLSAQEDLECQDDDVECLRDLLSQIDGEIGRLQETARKTEEQLHTTQQKLTAAEAALADAQTRGVDDAGAGPATEQSRNPPTKTGGSLQLVPMHEQLDNSSKTRAVGGIVADDVIVGIYQLDPPGLTMDAHRFGQSRLSLIFSPHVLPGYSKMADDREFFLRATVENPDKSLFRVQVVPGQKTVALPDLAPNERKIFPIHSQAVITWKISRNSIFSVGTYQSSLEAQLGSRLANSKEPIKWDKESVLLAPNLSIRAPDPVRWAKENLDLLSTALGVIGTGGIVGIWRAIQSSGRKSSRKG